MIQSIKKLTVVVILITVFTSCDQGPTLQTYFVDNEMQSGFISLDVPASVIDVENIELTEEQREAYESVDKLNVLAYKADSLRTDEFQGELRRVNNILKDDKYDELIRGGNSVDGKFVVKFLGDVENIDELILFGNANDQGFVIARVLGNDMNAKKLMTLQSVLQNANIEDSQLKELTDFFK
jgi:hypothetical protein